MSRILICMQKCRMRGHSHKLSFKINQQNTLMVVCNKLDGVNICKNVISCGEEAVFVFVSFRRHTEKMKPGTKTFYINNGNIFQCNNIFYILPIVLTRLTYFLEQVIGYNIVLNGNIHNLIILSTYTANTHFVKS